MASRSGALIGRIIVTMALSGCSTSDHSITASEYSRSCSASSDCIAIYQGTLGCCGSESCPNAAISNRDSAKYMSDYDARIPTCSPPPPCALLPLPGSCTGSASCENGSCVFVPGGEAPTN
jgi:hypothetical protein